MIGLKKLIMVGVIMATTLQAAPIVRFFELTTDPQKRANYSQVGVENLTTSIKNEKGTLAMYTSHKKDDPNLSYVVEIYENEDAYKIHANSPQFKKFSEMAKTTLIGRKVFETNPQFLAEKPEALYVEKNKDYQVNLAEVTVLREKNKEFKDIVTDEMKQSMQKEEGVIVMYAATLKEDPNKWFFFEIYKNNDAYLRHRETPHFKNYIEKTKDMATDKKVKELEGDTLVNKGGLYLEF
ncbi:antibiotic biosynthesis monooxygenase [Fusobacterium polymorphum]|uniref:Antibiotic biosynthesis monooxygenase n=1 Tax=Fusobacterium nucleatum subsp. polymorphum TaxID=76857 RepID=A0A2B7YJG7_FUSNP|nr:antibiotic biosynthesis monooxygenase [Fusobacterium polymorphum]PGH21199.1 antibiotic biosynthesis monooxygenase [Fusobacterium polymorphum]